MIKETEDLKSFTWAMSIANCIVLMGILFGKDLSQIPKSVLAVMLIGNIGLMIFWTMVK
jgi:hypothetical protein